MLFEAHSVRSIAWLRGSSGGARLGPAPPHPSQKGREAWGTPPGPRQKGCAPLHSRLYGYNAAVPVLPGCAWTNANRLPLARPPQAEERGGGEGTSGRAIVTVATGPRRETVRCSPIRKKYRMVAQRFRGARPGPATPPQRGKGRLGDTPRPPAEELRPSALPLTWLQRSGHSASSLRLDKCQRVAPLPSA
jgi:hypothetical protein